MRRTSKKKGRRYGPKASEKVERALHEMHRGTLRSGRSGAKVTRPEQAIAIGLSEARRDGAKVPRAKTATGKSGKNAKGRKPARRAAR